MRGEALRVAVMALGVAAGCRTGNPASAIAKPPSLDTGGASGCATATTSSEPLVVEWPSADRAKLEARLREGLAVVTYKDCGMRLADRCRVKGKYAYAGVTRKHDRVRIKNADDLYASLPAGALKLEGKLHSAGELNVAMTIVGRYDAGSEAIVRDMLEGDGCEGATHVVSAVTVGAFDFFAGADAGISASAGAFGVGAGAASQASKETLSTDGNALACDKSSTNDAVPPEGCGALLRLELVPIAAMKPTKVPDSAAMIAKSERLSNGLTLIVHEDHSTPEVTVLVRYKTGSINDAPQPAGMTHLMEHLMFETVSPTAKTRFVDMVRKLGPKAWNGTTNEAAFVVYETVPTAEWEKALAMEAERMGLLGSAVTPSVLTGQQATLAKEIQTATEGPFGSVHAITRSELFPPGHPYRALPIGDVAAIAKITLADVQSFHSGFFGPVGALVVLSGDVTMSTALPIAQKTLGLVPARVRPRVTPSTLASPLAAEKRIQISANVAFDRLVLQWVTPGIFESGDAELDVLAKILAADGDGRLEKKLIGGVYAARAVRVGQLSMNGASVFTIEVDAQAGHSLDELLATVDAVLASIREGYVSAAELERARASLTEPPQRGFPRALAIASYAQFAGNPSYRSHDIERYAKVSPQNIRDVASAFLANSRRLVVRVSASTSAPAGGVLVTTVAPTSPAKK